MMAHLEGHLQLRFGSHAAQPVAALDVVRRAGGCLAGLGGELYQAVHGGHIFTDTQDGRSIKVVIPADVHGNGGRKGLDSREEVFEGWLSRNVIGDKVMSCNRAAVLHIRRIYIYILSLEV